jgi:hypothetical protein
MSMRVWVKPLGTTLGVAAAAGAAQLGIAYGIAILLWAKDFADPGQGAWAGNLTWVCWLAATSVVLGVVIGPRVAPVGLPNSLVAQLATVVSSALGALVTVPLVGIPARYAELAGDSSPAATVVRIALVGVVLGAVVSVGVLLGRPLEWNTLAATGLLWLLALGSVLVSLGRGEPPDTARLAVWNFADQPGWFAVMAPMLTGALLLGAGLALLAKREGHNRVAVAVCGAPGPLLIAVAYLVAGPGSRPETGEQFLPYLAAPYAVLTGLLGSLLVSAIERPAPGDETAESELGTGPVAAIGPGPSGSDDAGPVDATSAGTTSLDATSAGTTSLDATSVDTTSIHAVPGGAALPAVALEAGTLPNLPVPGWRREPSRRSGEAGTATRAPADPTPEPTGGSLPAWVEGSSKDLSKDSGDSGGTDPESEGPAEGQGEWDEDAEWLAQIRGDDRPRTFTPAPEPPEPRRRKWSLFSDDTTDEEESAGDQR